MSNLNRRKQACPLIKEAKSPNYDVKEIYGVIPKDPKSTYDVREVIARIVDASEFDEFKALYGVSLAWRHPLLSLQFRIFVLP